MPIDVLSITIHNACHCLTPAPRCPPSNSSESSHLVIPNILIPSRYSHATPPCASLSQPVMPGAPHAPPPPFFNEICDRWARGVATTYDTAVLTALTTSTPLPPHLDAHAVAFLPTTRLPPETTAHLYHHIKNAARIHHHQNTSSSNTAAVRASLANALPSNPVFPPGLSAAPARLGLLSATMLAFAASHTVTWRVSLPLLTAAGATFCHAARCAGWSPIEDVEEASAYVCWTSGKHISDAKLAQTAMILSRHADGGDILPAGISSFADLRAPEAGASLLPRIWLRARVAVGTRSRLPISRSRFRLRRFCITPR